MQKTHSWQSKPSRTLYSALISVWLISLVCLIPAHALIADPLNSPAWEVMYKRFLTEGEVVFDDKVHVFGPKAAEDSLNVPVSFRATALQTQGITEIVVMADLNPIPLILRLYPDQVTPYLAFRIKLQQRSPVRVAVKTKDGVWHVNGIWIDAAGGGCTLPSEGTSSGDWSKTLGRVSANLWVKPQGNRLRVRVMHPMDTGLADGIPRFTIENLLLHSGTGEQLARLELHEPVSENPMLSFDVGKHETIKLTGRDNNGNLIKARVLY